MFNLSTDTIITVKLLIVLDLAFLIMVTIIYLVKKRQFSKKSEQSIKEISNRFISYLKIFEERQDLVDTLIDKISHKESYLELGKIVKKLNQGKKVRIPESF
jgi:hypothetical protein